MAAEFLFFENTIFNHCVCFLCFLPIHSGHQVRWTYQPGSHRRKVPQDLLIVLHPLGIFILVFLVFLVRKMPFAGIELTSQRVRRLRGTFELPGRLV